MYNFPGRSGCNGRLRSRHWSCNMNGPKKSHSSLLSRVESPKRCHAQSWNGGRVSLLWYLCMYVCVSSSKKYLPGIIFYLFESELCLRKRPLDVFHGHPTLKISLSLIPAPIIAVEPTKKFCGPLYLGE